MQLIDGKPVYAATDLVGFLACRHRFALERAAMGDLVDRPDRNDPEIELIRKRGYEHERRYRDDLEAAGRHVVEIQPDGSETDAGERLRAAALATRAALLEGVDVIYQATFFDGHWRGHADFLLRVDRPSALGGWSYEVADTKLARRVKASAILQICSYVEQLTAIQDLEPDSLHVVLGGSAREQQSLPVRDYMAYYRQVKSEFEAAAEAEAVVYPVIATYPDPVEHCDVCRWAQHCRDQRLADDDLSRVAGITGRQRAALKARGIRTRQSLSELELPVSPRIAGVGSDALERVRDQARIQVRGDTARTVIAELLQPERGDDGTLLPDRGLLALPEPSDHDLFFDIEGDPFALDDGVEYLFGVLEPGQREPDDPTRPRFHEIWSLDDAGTVTRPAEKAAFEQLVDLLLDRWRRDPSLHVYHYAAYERSALARLAQRHGTREAEVDELFRAGVLVDLFRIVRQSIRASVESYSIKKLEPLYGLDREVKLQSAGSSIVQFETWLEGGATEGGLSGEAILREIAGYNRDDVVSNWKLRNWLEARRWDLEAMIDERPARPTPGAPGAETTPATERDAAAQALAAKLTAGLPADPTTGNPEQRATWLLAQLLGWHRREDKAYWWRYYELLSMSDEQLLEAREPIGGLTFLEDLGPAQKGSARLQRFAFPVQEFGIRRGGQVTDPDTRLSTGTVDDIDEAGLTITLRRSPKHIEAGLPRALVPYDFVSTDPLQDSLLRVGRSVAANGIDGPGPYRAARDLLLRRVPSSEAGHLESLRREVEESLDAAVRLALQLGESTLAIQGPPGSGKTHTGAHLIVELVRQGRTVGVTANSHKVIGHLLDKVVEAAAGDARIRIGQRPGSDESPTCTAALALKDNDAAAAALADGTVTVVGGTAWAWSSEALAGTVDVLVVDEAGQLSLASTVALSAATKGLVLLGDPQQLDQPLRGSHPPGAERSALGHLLDGRATLPPAEGLFLDRTWRLHPDLCAFTSEVFYDLQLQPVAGLETMALSGGTPPANGTGVRWRPVHHTGNATDSEEEAAVVVGLVRELVSGATWTNREGVTAPVGIDDILVIAPYNAHVDVIKERLAAAGLATDRVGTVDRFQGQEAVVSIYAMASSSAEDAPRGMEFLYSLNRLNVATSRARCAAIVVASPELVRVECHTPRQMHLANALCRLVEVARRSNGSAPAPLRAGGTEPQIEVVV